MKFYFGPNHYKTLRDYDLNMDELIDLGWKKVGLLTTIQHSNALDDCKELFEENGFERHSIASITKLMTAMVALDHEIDWEKDPYTMSDLARDATLVMDGYGIKKAHFVVIQV